MMKILFVKNSEIYSGGILCAGSAPQNLTDVIGRIK